MIPSLALDDHDLATLHLRRLRILWSGSRWGDTHPQEFDLKAQAGRMYALDRVESVAVYTNFLPELQRKYKQFNPFFHPVLWEVQKPVLEVREGQLRVVFRSWHDVFGDPHVTRIGDLMYGRHVCPRCIQDAIEAGDNPDEVPPLDNHVGKCPVHGQLSPMEIGYAGVLTRERHTRNLEVPSWHPLNALCRRAYFDVNGHPDTGLEVPMLRIRVNALGFHLKMRDLQEIIYPALMYMISGMLYSPVVTVRTAWKQFIVRVTRDTMDPNAHINDIRSIWQGHELTLKLARHILLNEWNAFEPILRSVVNYTTTAGERGGDLHSNFVPAFAISDESLLDVADHPEATRKFTLQLPKRVLSIYQANPERHLIDQVPTFIFVGKDDDGEPVFEERPLHFSGQQMRSPWLTDRLSRSNHRGFGTPRPQEQQERQIDLTPTTEPLLTEEAREQLESLVTVE